MVVVHCCKKLHNYIFGKEICVEGDNKPLLAIFQKPLLSAPMRLQSLLLRLQLYDIKLEYKPGKEVLIADVLSRANLPGATPDIEFAAVNMVNYISVAPEKDSFNRLPPKT